MDIIPLLKSKLVVPEIPDRALYSERLKKLNIAGHRAVIINAPAGFGKTTAVLLSTQKERSSVRWYRMEKEDSFLQVFYAHLIETLFGSDTGKAMDSVRSLGSIGNLSVEYPLLNAVICQDAWMLYSSQNNHHIYMVFDDFHNVAGNAAIVETIKYLLVNMPPMFRIIIISRTGADILSGKLTLDGDVIIIDEQALRFTKDETIKLINEIYNLRMNEKDIDRMHEYSEGWISGITMLSHTTGKTLPDMRMPLVSGDDSRQSIFRYFVSEAFEGYGIDRLKTLVRISILENFTCGDLKSVFEITNAEETLSWLVKSNMYIQKIK